MVEKSMIFYLSLFLLLFFGISVYCYLELTRSEILDGVERNRLRHRIGVPAMLDEGASFVVPTIVDEGASLVGEVLADLPVEEKGEREEWEQQIGIHRKEDIYSLSDAKPKQHVSIVPPSPPLQQKQQPLQQQQQKQESEGKEGQDENIWDKVREFFLMAQRDPVHLLHLLEDSDPFRTLHPESFKCPLHNLDDRDNADENVFCSYNSESSSAFKFRERHNKTLSISLPHSLHTSNDKSSDKSNFAFVWYQHLRKAGGTGFCELAKSNMPPKEVPPYYCMPDNRGSLATPPWHDPSYLYEHMTKKAWRVCSNEWDAYNSKYHNNHVLPGAVFVTSMRHPLDRWYSQYRFEHLEHRDGSAKTAKRQSFEKYYQSLLPYAQGSNYYVKTFAGHDDHKKAKEKAGDFYWTFHKYRHINIDYTFFLSSLRHLQNEFHLILITEFLDIKEHMEMIESVLGWTVKPKKILPHESQALRVSGSGSGSGSGGSGDEGKVSYSARHVLTPAQYDKLGVDNIFDVLYYHVVRRIVLERMYCIQQKQ